MNQVDCHAKRDQITAVLEGTGHAKRDSSLSC